MEDFILELYEEEEIDALENHISTYFGHNESVFHEIISTDIHVDVHIIEPTAKRNFYTLVTVGMGAHKMNVPEELKENKLERAELLITLPPKWKVTKTTDKWYWPIDHLKRLARLPIHNDTWIGWGHTMADPNSGPIARNTKLNSMILMSPCLFDENATVCKLPNGDEVNFYQLMPIYQEELDYKFEHGADKLLELLFNNPEGLDTAIVNIKRKNSLTK